MSTAHASPSYRTYWVIWSILLALTLAMVFIGAKPILIGGMLAKASLITLVYMHLVHEKRNLIWTVLLGIFLTSAVLVVLLVISRNVMAVMKFRLKIASRSGQGESLAMRAKA